MPSRRLIALLGLLLLSFSIALLHELALAEFLYWRWLWFDLVMHTLGGMLIGSIAVLISTYTEPSPYSRHRFLTFLVLLIGISAGWELLEWKSGIYESNAYVLDTALDLLANTIGASLVYFTATWKKSR